MYILLTNHFCTIVPCPAEGQSYSSNCRQINATCSNHFIPAICDLPMCACPLGQVVNETTNKCVDISECCKCTLSLYNSVMYIFITLFILSYMTKYLRGNVS